MNTTITDSIVDIFKEYVMPNYSRNPVVIVKGEGSYVWDADGNRYLDLFPGWGVSGIGYGHPRVVSAIECQAKKLIHMPNNYYNELQGELARVISEKSFPGKSFFCNSGAEAVETVLKLARKWGHDRGKFEIITMKNSFHGRTFGAMTATGQPKYQKEFEPVLPGFKYVPYGDIDVLKAAVTEKTCLILVEPIQGEGGVNMASKEYFEQARRLCDEKEILLAFDEVQTGVGRTGKWFGYQHYGVQPDVMTLAKILGGGFPIGAVIAEKKIADTLVPGNHASTYGGSPLACAASLAVFEAIEQEGMLENAEKMGCYFLEKLDELKQKYDFIKEARGLGLMIGVEVAIDGTEIPTKCMEKGLLINCTAGKVIRFLPALNIKKELIDAGLEIFDSVLAEVK